MRETLLTALAVAITLSAGTLGHRAEAMTRAAPSALSAATADASLVEQATVVCGSNGCVRVETSRVRRQRPLHR